MKWLQQQGLHDYGKLVLKSSAHAGCEFIYMYTRIHRHVSDVFLFPLFIPLLTASLHAARTIRAGDALFAVPVSLCLHPYSKHLGSLSRKAITLFRLVV